MKLTNIWLVFFGIKFSDFLFFILCYILFMLKDKIWRVNFEMCFFGSMFENKAKLVIFLKLDLLLPVIFLNYLLL